MLDFIDIDCCPGNEEGIQVCKDKIYYPVMFREAKMFKKQIKEAFDSNNTLTIKVNRNEHEFGPYTDLRICYNDEDENECNLAFEIENSLPEYWNVGFKDRFSYASFLSYYGIKLTEARKLFEDDATMVISIYTKDLKRDLICELVFEEELDLLVNKLDYDGVVKFLKENEIKFLEVNVHDCK